MKSILTVLSARRRPVVAFVLALIFHLSTPWAPAPWEVTTAAQTVINSTTTSAAIDAKQQILPLTAVTNIAIASRNLTGDLVYFADNSGEAVQVNALDTNAKTITVTRGVRSTPVTAHLSGVTVYTGPAQRFSESLGFGTCTATNEQYLPRIVLNRNVMQDCLGGQWVQTNANGFPVLGSTVASVAGVIAATGTVFTVSGTNAITGITLPNGTQPGFRLSIVPSGVFTWTAAGNIALAGTAVVNKVLDFVWNGTKWVPSYIA
jgi:hypothetical protein